MVTADGYILTNNHVIVDQQGEPVDEITIQFKDGKEYDAEIVGRDPKTDIAVLKIENDDPLPSITFADSTQTRVGDVVFAIGNPLGVGHTVSSGIVSALGRSIGILGQQGYENFIQVDAPINRGNSGGALIDAKGRLIGINTAISSNTGGSIGIGFAVPTNIARNIMDQLVVNGEVSRGYLESRLMTFLPNWPRPLGSIIPKAHSLIRYKRTALPTKEGSRPETSSWQ